MTDELKATNPPEYEPGSLLWRLKFAYNNPFREFLLIEAATKIERLQNLSGELVDALTEMAEKGLLPQITIRLQGAVETLEKELKK